MEGPLRKAVFVVPPAVHLLDINGPAHLFYEAREYGAPITLHFIRLLPELDAVPSSAGLHFSNLQEFTGLSLGENDAIFLPGLTATYLLETDFLAKAAPFFDWIKAQHQAGATVCSICTGAFLLARTGLLNGKPATTHWKYLELFRKTFPLVEILPDRLFTFSDRLYTSAGVTSGIDLGLYLLEAWYGPRFAAEIAKEVVVYVRRSADDPQLSIFLQHRNHLNHQVHRVQESIIDDLSRPWTIADLAALVHTSSRNLTRLFKTHTGITIGKYLRQLRKERALELLDQGRSVVEVVEACGLSSTVQLRRLINRPLP